MFCNHAIAKLGAVMTNTKLSLKLPAHPLQLLFVNDIVRRRASDTL